MGYSERHRLILGLRPGLRVGLEIIPKHLQKGCPKFVITGVPKMKKKGTQKEEKKDPRLPTVGLQASLPQIAARIQAHKLALKVHESHKGLT